MAIPDNVWKVLVEHRGSFPITETDKTGRIHGASIGWLAEAVMINDEVSFAARRL